MFDQKRTQRDVPAPRWTLFCCVGVVGLIFGHPAAATASTTQMMNHVGGSPGIYANKPPTKPPVPRPPPRTPNIHHLPSWANQAVFSSYGNWTDSPDYGYVWAPTVYHDWTPQDKGYWTTDHQGGHVWRDSTPWTTATAHYGTWMQMDSTWVWAPWVGSYPSALTDDDYVPIATTQPQASHGPQHQQAPAKPKSHAIYSGPKVDVFSDDSAGGRGSANAGDSDHSVMMEIPNSDSSH
jgi:hypothetical protein